MRLPPVLDPGESDEQVSVEEYRRAQTAFNPSCLKQRISKKCHQCRRGNKMLSLVKWINFTKTKKSIAQPNTVSASLHFLQTMASSHKLFHGTYAALSIWVKSFHNQVFCAGINIVPVFSSLLSVVCLNARPLQ